MVTIYIRAAAPALQNLTLKPEEIAKIAKEGKGSMPKGVFKGTDEELKKLLNSLQSIIKIKS